ncbi:MAG TPA: type IV toxin-antitoxin system AbiEi family antitoxin domain-containing protein [Thermoleophilaceae bacterium]|nr:type IV toxin-antitoxin system AbiEi family antitoxin domain-containing protein [Thermoleophilaceae bacterium]
MRFREASVSSRAFSSPVRIRAANSPAGLVRRSVTWAVSLRAGGRTRWAALARRQYGVVTRAQLIAAGVGETGIEERVRTHRLLRLHRGVYALGHRELKGEGHWMAAVLACGPGAVLSHASAAAHWNIRVSASSYVDVTVPTRAGRIKRKGLRIHRSGRLGPTQVTMHEGIPVTTLARTLLDLADILNLQGLKRAIHEADYLRLLDMTALIAVVESNPGRRGGKLLKAAQTPPEMTKTKLEEGFLAIIERPQPPPPKGQHANRGLRSGLRLARGQAHRGNRRLRRSRHPQRVRSRPHPRPPPRPGRLSHDPADSPVAPLRSRDRG